MLEDAPARAHHGVMGDFNLTYCPETALGPPFHSQFGRPIMLTVAWSLSALLGIFYAVVTMVKYNSVPVFGKKVRTAHISNMYWIAYFLSEAVAAAVNLFRFEFDSKHHQDERDVYDVYILFYGITSCSLLLALNHQRKFRSKSTAMESSVNAQWKGNCRRPCEYRHRILIDLMILGVFMTFLCAAITTFCMVDRIPGVDWFFFGTIVLLRTTCLILGMVIVFNSQSKDSKYTGLDAALIADGPSMATRACIFIAVLISTIINLPPSMWAMVLPHGCIFHYGTLYDVFQLLSFVAVTLFFVVVRAEYRRNMEECIWFTVSLIQDAWQFNETF